MSYDISGSPVADSTPPLQSARVQPLAGELQSCTQTFFFVFSQYVSSQGVSQLVPDSLAEVLRLVTGSPLPTVHMFLNLVFCVEHSDQLSFPASLQEWVFCPLQFYNFPGFISHWFSKSGISGACLSCVGSRGWDG